MRWTNEKARNSTTEIKKLAMNHSLCVFHFNCRAHNVGGKGQWFSWVSLEAKSLAQSQNRWRSWCSWRMLLWRLFNRRSFWIFLLNRVVVVRSPRNTTIRVFLCFACTLSCAAVFKLVLSKFKGGLVSTLHRYKPRHRKVHNKVS